MRKYGRYQTCRFPARVNACPGQSPIRLPAAEGTAGSQRQARPQREALAAASRRPASDPPGHPLPCSALWCRSDRTEPLGALSGGARSYRRQQNCRRRLSPASRRRTARSPGATAHARVECDGRHCGKSAKPHKEPREQNPSRKHKPTTQLFPEKGAPSKLSQI